MRWTFGYDASWMASIGNIILKVMIKAPCFIQMISHSVKESHVSRMGVALWRLKFD